MSALVLFQLAPSEGGWKKMRPKACVIPPRSARERTLRRPRAGVLPTELPNSHIFSRTAGWESSFSRAYVRSYCWFYRAG
jgi:hypothetical protein